MGAVVTSGRMEVATPHVGRQYRAGFRGWPRGVAASDRWPRIKASGESRASAVGALPGDAPAQFPAILYGSRTHETRHRCSGRSTPLLVGTRPATGAEAGPGQAARQAHLHQG